MNIVTIKINGVEYNLKGEEKEEYLHRVASYVDKKVKNIMGSNDKLSTASASVLSAVNAVDDLFKYQEKYEALQKEMEIMQETAGKYIEECNVLKAENKELKFQLQSSKYKIVDLQKKLVDNQITLAKEKKQNHPLLKNKSV